MGTISVSLPSDGTTADVADYNTPITTIVNEFNGNIDNANIKSAAAISGSKLADNSIDLEAKASVDTGWREVSDSWTYASATSVTVPSDATTKYSVGDRIKFSQSGTKYFYVTAVAATTLTLSGGSDYTVANASITDVYYSKAASPLGFPAWFTFSTTYAGFSGNPTSTNRFKIDGRTVTMTIHPTANGTSNATTFTLTAPVTSSNAATNQWTAPAVATNNNALTGSPGLAVLPNNSTTITLYASYQQASWTNTSGKAAGFTLAYEI